LPIVNTQTGEIGRQETAARLVLLVLADYASDDNDPIARPSVETVTKETNLSRRTVQRALRTLEEAGLIEVVSYAGGGFTSRRYRLLLDEAIERADEIENSTSTRPVTGDTGDVRGVTGDVRGDTGDARGVTGDARGDSRDTRTPKNPHQHPENTSERGGGGEGSRTAPRQGSERSRPHLTEEEEIDLYGAFCVEVEDLLARTLKTAPRFDRANIAGRREVARRIRAGWKLDRLARRAVDLDLWPTSPKNNSAILVARLQKLAERPDSFEKKAVRQDEELRALVGAVRDVFLDAEIGFSSWPQLPPEYDPIDDYSDYMNDAKTENAGFYATFITKRISTERERHLDTLRQKLGDDFEAFASLHAFGPPPPSKKKAAHLRAEVEAYRRLCESLTCVEFFLFDGQCDHTETTT